MLNSAMRLNPDLYKNDVEQIPTRKGFGEGLLEAGIHNNNVVGISADLTESTQMHLFAEHFPERAFNVGVAEQNLATVAAGMAVMGKVPFISSYATFSPGRNWEQIRTTICLNDANVKIAGSHAGVSVGPDGATHQALEDIAIMRALPNMRVIVPCDAIEAKKATLAIADNKGPSYLRLAREKSPLITTKATPFSLDKAQVFKNGTDVSIIACGPLVFQGLLAARQLHSQGVEAEVINCAVIKPLDRHTILDSVGKTGAVVSVEEHQVNGGLGGAIAELLSENMPVPVERIGVKDHFGESGTADELMEKFGLTAPYIIKAALEVIKRKAQ